MGLQIEPQTTWHIYMHILVMLCFLNPSIEQQSIVDLTDDETKALKEKPLEVHHRDGARVNNDFSNLEIVTQSCHLLNKYLSIYLIAE